MKVDDTMLKTFKVNNQDETINVGEKLGNVLENGDVVLLEGDLSAGKTTSPSRGFSPPMTMPQK